MCVCVSLEYMHSRSGPNSALPLVEGAAIPAAICLHTLCARFVPPHDDIQTGIDPARQHYNDESLMKPSRRRDCHFADTSSPPILKHLRKGEGGAAE